MIKVLPFLLLSSIVSLSLASNRSDQFPEAAIETFTFSSGGVSINGKIYLPATFDRNDNIPSVYLIDFQEQHGSVAIDEFPKVIGGISQIQDVDAVVVTLEEHLNFQAGESDIQRYYDIYKDMAAYIDANYTNNPNRTFIGRGSEGGIVMGAMFLEDPNDPVFVNFIATDSPGIFNSNVRDAITGNAVFPNMPNKKLHFSFSSSNNRSDCISVINAIEQAQYPWLQFEAVEYATRTYDNLYQTVFPVSLAWVFSTTSTGYDIGDVSIPTDISIGQNYPNPFNLSTSIEYSVHRTGMVNLKVYDLLGHEVMEVVNKEQPVGEYTIEFGTDQLPSGVYLYQLFVAGAGETRKMIKVN